MTRPFSPFIVLGLALFVLLGTCSAPLVPRPLAIRMPTPTVAPARIAPPPTRLPAQVARGAGGPAASPTPAPQAATRSPQPTLATAPSPTAQPTIPVTAGQFGLTVDRYMRDLVKAGWFSGAILVAQKGQILFSNGYGMADADNGLPNSADTRFRLASMTKQFTAMAIMILQSRGQLDVRDSICDYLDPCPDTWRQITIRHLLTHTSGIPDYTDFADFEATETQPVTPEQLVARFRNKPLEFNPGAVYDYNNSGYVLLGLIIERVAGQPYDDFVRQQIFEPLQMNNSGLARADINDPLAAEGYRSSGTHASPLDPSTLYAAGALYSTIGDLYLWDRALYTERLVPQTALDEMFTPYKEHYGYGWKITDQAGRRMISHAGSISGFSTYSARFPDDDVTVIVLSNFEAADARGICLYLADLVFTR